MAMKSVKKSMMNLDELREMATQIAVKAHKGQVDKGGHDYIYHPLRVEAKCNSLEEKIVALLHDTVEDGGVAAEYLLMRGFPQNIVDAVLSVSRKEREDYFDFILRCKENPIGRVVKIRDLEDNMDITRLNELTEKDIERLKKYHKAYSILKNGMMEKELINKIAGKYNIDCCQLLKVCNEVKYKDRLTTQDFRQLNSLGLPVLTLMCKKLNCEKEMVFSRIVEGKVSYCDFASLFTFIANSKE